MGFASLMLTPGIAPPWLNGPVAASKMTMLGNTLDMLTGTGGKLAQAAEAGMPTKCDSTLLPFIGDDRLMPQGLGETTPSYRLRLRGAMPEWQQFSGNPWGVLRECRNQLLPNEPMMRSVGGETVWDWYIDGADDSPPPYHAVETGPTFNWRWDGANNNYEDPTDNPVGLWWRFWIIIYSISPTVWTTTLGTWGGTGKTWGDTTISWGFATPPAIFLALQSGIVRRKAAHAWCRWMIVSFDGTLFDPGHGPDGTHNPNGTFGRWSHIVNGQYVPARFANARYANVPL